MSHAKSYKGFGTKVIHSAQEPNPIHGAIMPGIELSTTYAQTSPGVFKGFDYSRSGNPTRQVLENLLAAVENGKYGTCYSSGCAATQTVLSAFLKAGEHCVCIDDVYGGTNRLLCKIGEDVNNIRVSFVDLGEAAKEDPYQALERCIRKNKSKLLWIETPTNPTLKCADIKQLCEVAHRHNVLVAVDNTFATPFNQKPLDLGADMVVHSITKYLNGHSDIVMGCVVTRSKELHERLVFIQYAAGAVPSPFDCYMVIRGMKTLNVRMQRHAENGLKVAQFLEAHPKVDRVFYPGLRSHPNYEVARRQMKTGGGMVAFLLKGGLKESRIFLENVKLIKCAESLGAVESLIEHPAIMTHASVPAEQRKILGISDSFIRISVGSEDIRDILHDLETALNAVDISHLSSKL